MRTKIKKILLLIIGLLVFGLIIFYNREFSLENLSNLNFYLLIAAFLIHIFQEIIIAIRWQLMIDSFSGAKVMPFYKYFFYLTLSYMAGLLGFNEFTGAVVRMGALKLDKQVSIYKSFNSVVAEKYLDLINLIIIFIPCILYYFKILTPPLAILLILFEIFILLFLIQRQKAVFLNLIYCLNKIFLKIFQKIPWLNKKIDKETYLDENKNLLFESNLLLKLNSLSIIKLLSSSFIAYFVFRSLNIDIDLITVILVTPIVQLSLIFAFTPAGLGILETGWFIALKIVSISPVDINNFLITRRITSVLFILSTTLFAYLFYIIKNHKRMN